MVDFLKNPDKYTALGAKIPKVSSVSPMRPLLTLFPHQLSVRASVSHDEASVDLPAGIEKGGFAGMSPGGRG